jgi:AcrR family transcriptional regulator
MSIQTAGRRPGKARGPYAKSAEVREKILEACIDAFGLSGFNGATLKDVAERAGISQAGLLHHFSNKEELLKGVLAAHAAHSTALVRKGSGDIFRGQLDVVRDNLNRPGIIQLHSVIAAEGTAPDHPAHEMYHDRYEKLRLYLAGAFDQLRASDRLKIDAPSEVLASLFIASLDGMQLQWLYNPELDLPGAIETLLSSFIRQDEDSKV